MSDIQITLDQKSAVLLHGILTISIEQISKSNRKDVEDSGDVLLNVCNQIAEGYNEEWGVIDA